MTETKISRVARYISRLTRAGTISPVTGSTLVREYTKSRDLMGLIEGLILNENPAGKEGQLEQVIAEMSSDPILN